MPIARADDLEVRLGTITDTSRPARRPRGMEAAGAIDSPGFSPSAGLWGFQHWRLRCSTCRQLEIRFIPEKGDPDRPLHAFEVKTGARSLVCDNDARAITGGLRRTHPGSQSRAQAAPPPAPAQSGRGADGIPSDRDPNPHADAASSAQISRRPTVPPPPPPPPPPGPPAPRANGRPVNVKFDLIITDQRSGAAPVTRTLSVVVADGQRGMVRSGSDVVGGALSLNVDAFPTLIAGGRIRVYFTLHYDLPVTAEQLNGRMPRGTVVKTSTNESVALVLDDGKPVVAAQSADPVTDRRVSVEVKATILR